MTIFQTISKEALAKTYYYLLALALSTAVNFYFISSWALIFCSPVVDQTQFIFTEVDEAFGAACLLAFYISFQMVFPVFCYEVITFFSPALFQKELKTLTTSVLAFLAINGVVHASISQGLIQPLVKFFLQFQFEIYQFPLVTFQAKIFSYITFVLSWYLLVQFLVFVCWLSFVVVPTQLQRFWVKKKSLVFFLSTLLVAFVIPPDGLVQCIFTASTLLVLDCFGFFLFLSLKYQEKTLY
jgi:Sec-independent protein secretion pathway component TatC